ncbi:MAG: subtilisin family serine protease [Flavobacteriales bacterium]|jgi:subtilisin family serine protease
MHSMKSSTLYFFLILFSFTTSAQQAPDNWFNLDIKQTSTPGVSTDRAYEDLLKGLASTTVIVAVIDSGVDIDHEDLQENIWVNEDEIADNGIDDDNNGYIDDIHGWSFIGDVHFDNLEFTRVYKSLLNKFNGKTKKDISGSEKEEFARYELMKTQYEKRVSDAEKEVAEFQQIAMFYDLAKKTVQDKTGKEEITMDDVNALEASDEFMEAVKGFLQYALENDFDAEVKEGKRHYHNVLAYSYNMSINSREIIGDDYSDVNQRDYGNNHVEGPAADHGTHVAGIIGAVRDNEIGMKGIVADVAIMVLRCVPDGDERDKDVANSIRYAVDNGAKVINMSFGKSYSPFKGTVDEAMKYAEDNGVVMVHAAGNSSRNNDKSENFPNPVYEETRELCPVWIEVGASSWDGNGDFVAGFSNYGKRSVDIFAPGVDIYSTVPGGGYRPNSGTSMAAPVVSGVAALLFSYFPELSGKDVKQIIVNSYVDYAKVKVTRPGSEKSVKFKKICRTGGMINAYNAVKMASSWQQSTSAE